MSEASDFHMAAHATTPQRADHPYLDDEQWAYLDKMDALVGTESVLDLLAQEPGDVVARIARFRDYEISLKEHFMEVVAVTVAASAKPPPPPTPNVTYVQSPAPPPKPAGPKPVRVSVSAFSGEEDENLVFWARENELAMAAASITDARQKITFGISNMKGRAKVWALTCETSHPGYFTSWTAMVAAMKDVFLPPNVAHRQRAAFLASRQGDRDLYVYVQELRQLIASMAANSIAEDVKLTTFIENMKGGPCKAAVFRSKCTSLEEAFAIALNEDYVQRATRGLPVQAAPAHVGGPPPMPSAEPMDLSMIDLSGIDLNTVDLSAIDANALHIKCFTCGKFGHYQRDCPRNRGDSAFRGRRGRGISRGRARYSGYRGGRSGTTSSASTASSGNASSQ